MWFRVEKMIFLSGVSRRRKKTSIGETFHTAVQYCFFPLASRVAGKKSSVGKPCMP